MPVIYLIPVKIRESFPNLVMPEHAPFVEGDNVTPKCGILVDLAEKRSDLFKRSKLNTNCVNGDLDVREPYTGETYEVLDFQRMRYPSCKNCRDGQRGKKLLSSGRLERPSF